jgi:multiple sugar transport system substrate-binding protein
MIITGPWDLPQFPDVQYGVQIMPAFAGVGDHQSISGPDNWVVLDHGPDRVDAAYGFLRWLSQPAQVQKFSLATGDLPTRRSLAGDEQFMRRFESKLHGVSTFVENLGNVKQSRPATADYSKVSEQLGQAIVSVLLGKKQPQAALSDAAAQTRTVLGQG